MTTPTSSSHEAQMVATLTSIAARHATDTRLPLALAVVGTLVVGGPLLAYFGLLDGSTGTSFRRIPLGGSLLAPALIIAILVVMLVIAVHWDSRRTEASKRRILSDVATAFPDPTRHAQAMAAVRDLKIEGGTSDVLGSLQNDLRKEQASTAGSPLLSDRSEGDDVTRFCAQCGKPATQDTRFCPYCGAPSA